MSDQSGETGEPRRGGMVRIALLQMTSIGDDQRANLAKGVEWCRQAKRIGADLALFPEMWNIGYRFRRPGDDETEIGQAGPALDTDVWKAPEMWNGQEGPYPTAEFVARWRAQAIGVDSDYVRAFRQLAKELDMAIAVTYLEAWDGPPRNTVSLIDRHGEIVLTYAKVHTCDFDFPEVALTSGDAFPVATLDTAEGPVQIGAMICYDREFPESSRLLMLGGAEIVITPNACPLDTNRIEQFRTRATENMVGVAMTNYAAPQQNGHSVAFDGMPYEHPGPDGLCRDTLIVEAGEGEGIFIAAFDLHRLRTYRLRETYGNTFRRPHRYGLLTSTTVEPPFVRVDATGERYDPTRR